MMKRNMVVVCAGAPGNGRDEILLRTREKASFPYYHLFDYIVEAARLEGVTLTKLNILDFYDSQPEKMEDYRRSAIEKITKEIEGREGTHIISTPYHFEWKGNRFRGLRKEEVEALDPDLFIIIIDDIVRVRERLSQDPQWREHKFTLGEIANWRREEVSGVYELAKGFTPSKEIQLVAYGNGEEFLGEIIFKRLKKKVYLSHPITGEGEDFFKKVRGFASTISDHYIVYDPYVVKDWSVVEAWRQMLNEAREKGLEMPPQFGVTIEYEDGTRRYELDSAEVESAIKNIRFQIIDTDYKIIENSSAVVVYHPRESISAGVMCEMVYAKGLAKLVYVYYPYEPSPFFEWYSTRIFQDEKELRDHLIRESKPTGQTPLDLYTSREPMNP
jgi:adenylate kinase